MIDWDDLRFFLAMSAHPYPLDQTTFPDLTTAAASPGIRALAISR